MFRSLIDALKWKYGDLVLSKAVEKAELAWEVRETACGVVQILKR
jgi:hypothetical protein